MGLISMSFREYSRRTSMYYKYKSNYCNWAQMTNSRLIITFCFLDLCQSFDFGITSEAKIMLYDRLVPKEILFFDPNCHLWNFHLRNLLNCNKRIVTLRNEPLELDCQNVIIKISVVLQLLRLDSSEYVNQSDKFLYFFNIYFLAYPRIVSVSCRLDCVNSLSVSCLLDCVNSV